MAAQAGQGDHRTKLLLSGAKVQAPVHRNRVNADMHKICGTQSLRSDFFELRWLNKQERCGMTLEEISGPADLGELNGEQLDEHEEEERSEVSHRES